MAARLWVSIREMTSCSRQRGTKMAMRRSGVRLRRTGSGKAKGRRGSQEMRVMKRSSRPERRIQMTMAWSKRVVREGVGDVGEGSQVFREVSKASPQRRRKVEARAGRPTAQ